MLTHFAHPDDVDLVMIVGRLYTRDKRLLNTGATVLLVRPVKPLRE